MSTYPSEGIAAIIVEELARDALIRGLEGSTEIEARPARERAPEFMRDGDALVIRGAPVVRLSVPPGVSVIVREAAGNLRVHDLTGDLTVEAAYGEMRVDRVEATVRVGQVNGGLRAERVAALRLDGLCNGDLRLQECADVAAQTVSGDLRLYRCSNMLVEHVRGDVWVEKQGGPLEIGQTDGDARLSEVTGFVKLGAVLGDLRGVALTGGVQAPAVTGDLHLQGPYLGEQAYQVSADGDGDVRIPEGSELRLSVSAHGRIRSDLQLSPTHDGTPSYSTVLGRGVTPMTVSCAGDLRIGQGGDSVPAGAPAGLADLGERIRQQVAASLASAGISIETGEAKWAPGASRTLRGREGRAPGPAHPPPPSRPVEHTGERGRPAAKNVSSEEQMMILRMVSEGAITPEEAEALLRALGA